MRSPGPLFDLRNHDVLLGIVIFGMAGGLIGYYLRSWPVILGGIGLGCVLGSFIARLGARRFFLSVLTGTLLGGLLGWVAGGTEVVPVTAGTGSAIGGFVGINIELLIRAHLARKRGRGS